MTGHICIIFTTTILGVHIFHYYSSNSITCNPTVFTGVITSVCRQTNTCACLVTLAIDVVETAMTCSCSVRFLTSFLNFHCLNITTLFNIDVKNTFSCRYDCQLLYCHSAPLLWTFIFFNTCLRYFSLHFLV